MAHGLTDPLPSPWARLWQIPLLLAGVGVFAFGLQTWNKSHKQIPFEAHVAQIQRMLDARQYQMALDQIAQITEFFPANDQQAKLEKLSGDAFGIVVESEADPVPENCRKLVEHYTRALRRGSATDLLMEQRWGMAALGLQDYPAAIEHLEPVIQAKPEKLPEYARSLVQAYLGTDPPQEAKALAVLEKMLKQPRLEDRVFALTKRLELTFGKAGMEQAINETKAALGGIPDRAPAGVLLCWIGRAEYERGRLDDAKTYLTEARSKFLDHNLDDGRAALLLGKIAQAKGELDTAKALFQEVVTSHAGSVISAAARLGRADVLSEQGTPDDQMKADYSFAIGEILVAEGRKGKGPAPEFLSRQAVHATLLAGYQRYADLHKPADALEFLNMDRLLKEPETADGAFHAAVSEEQLAGQLEGQAAALPAEDAQRHVLQQRAIAHYALAAEARLRHSKLTIQGHDELSGDSLWRAAGLFDKAGKSGQAIDAYTQFVAGRPKDSRVPEGLHAIGQLYQSMGQFEQAIDYFQRNIKENRKVPISYLSSVQMARCYMAQGEEQFPKAEAALLEVVESSRDLLPTANEFRVSVFTLGELYYRTKRWSDAILRLEEALTRYPNDPLALRATYWLADSYRKSAAEVAAALKKDPQMSGHEQMDSARQDRLHRAIGLFSQVINTLDAPVAAGADPAAEAEVAAARTGVDDDYLRFSYLYRADCYFDLGDYPKAIKLYDQTAARFGQTLTAMEAYLQVVNAYLALKEPEQAAAAAERARWVLKRIPDDAFGKGPLAFSRRYYEDILKLGHVGP